MINKNMKIVDIIKQKPKSHEIMVEFGLHCIGCMGASFESLEQGASAHGLSDEKINSMVEKINKIK